MQESVIGCKIRLQFDEKRPNKDTNHRDKQGSIPHGGQIINTVPHRGQIINTVPHGGQIITTVPPGSQIITTVPHGGQIITTVQYGGQTIDTVPYGGHCESSWGKRRGFRSWSSFGLCPTIRSVATGNQWSRPVKWRMACRVPVETDRIVGLSVIVDQGL